VPGKANLPAVVQEVVGILTASSQQISPPGSNPTSSGGVLPLANGGPGPGPHTEAAAPQVDLESLSTAQLEELMTDEDKFSTFMTNWVRNTQAARALAEIQRQNVALAQDNLSMQGSIDEARNHVAIVRSSEYAGAKSAFDDLYRRHEAVVAKLSPFTILQQMRAKTDKLDLESGEIHDQYLSGRMTVDQFVDQYCTKRVEYHYLDLMSQATEYTAMHMTQ